MQIKQVKTFKFNELSERSQRKAIENWIGMEEYPFFDEAMLSLKTFVENFGGSVKDYSMGDGRNTFVKTTLSPASFRGKKLKDFDPNYMPTGTCFDGGIWSEFYHEFRKTGDAYYASQIAIEQLLLDVRNDVENYFSDEYVIETFEANDWDFTADGSFFFGEVANA